MNIIDENKSDAIREKQRYIATFSIKDSYLDSQIPSFDINNLRDLYDQIFSLEKAIENGDVKSVSSYFNKYSYYIDKTTFNENDSFEYIEFILPYIDKFMQVNTHKEILDYVLLSVYYIVASSHYYSLRFVNSSVIQQLLSIIQANITDYITGISFNIIYSLSLYDDLHDICLSIFSIQKLFEYLLSKDYKDLTKDAIIYLIGMHLIDTIDDQKLFEIFSLILQCLTESKLYNISKDISLRLLAVIGRFFFRNEGASIDTLPQKLKEFISNHFLEISHADSAIENDLFYLIHYLINNGIEINYPVEEIYQLILGNEITNKIKEYLIGEMVYSIKVKDDIEYSRQFITKSLKEVIEYGFEYGSIKIKTGCTILLGAILVTNKYELFLSFLSSASFNDFISFIKNSDDENTIVFGVGILGNAFHYLQTTMPDSGEIKFFVSILLENDFSKSLCLIADHSPYSSILFEFCSLIENGVSCLS